MGVERRLKRLGAMEGKTMTDFVSALGEADASQSWGGNDLLIWRTWRGSLPVLFDREGLFVKITRLEGRFPYFGT